MEKELEKEVLTEEKVLFENLEISDEIKRAIKDMGFEEATPVQSQSMGPMMEGRDIVAQAPTGTGKTCAFGIPVIEGIDMEARHVQALVLCPTRELVVQTTNELLKLTKYKHSIRIVPIYGGQNMERQIMALKRKPQIIVATPGRLMDHMRRHTIRLENLQYMVLDEADEMLNMGFREDIDTILESVPEERQTVLFSATMSKEILDITTKYLTEPARVQITKKEITVPNIRQFYLEVNQENKVDVLARLIDVNDFKLSMIFCNTKRGVDELAHEMIARGYQAEALHGDMKQSQRDWVMKTFKEGRAEILIATDVAARGLDIENVEAVFNYDLPEDMEYYVHRIGRTGRANREGVSYSFVGHRDMYKLRQIMNYTKANIKYKKIPRAADIAHVRTQLVMKDLLKVMESEHMERYSHLIEKIMSQEEFQNYTIMDVAAAFLSKQIPADTFKEIEEKPRFADMLKKRVGRKGDRREDHRDGRNVDRRGGRRGEDRRDGRRGNWKEDRKDGRRDWKDDRREGRRNRRDASKDDWYTQVRSGKHSEGADDRSNDKKIYLKSEKKAERRNRKRH